MTGPIWTQVSRGSPSFSSSRRAGDHRRASCRRHPPARRAAAAPSSAGRRSGRRRSRHRRPPARASAVASTIMALMPPVSAISGTIGPSLAASARLIAPGRLGRAGEGDAGDVRVADEPRADRAVAGDEVQRGGGHARLVQRAARPRSAMSGVCSAGLATTALPAASAAATWPRKMASGKFQGLMQTKTPRPRCRSMLLLAGRARQHLAVAEQAARLSRVVAAEVDGLAHLGDARRRCVLPASPWSSAMKRAAPLLEQVGGALAAPRRAPPPACAPRRGSPPAPPPWPRRRSAASASVTSPTTLAPSIGREHRARLAGARLAIHERRGLDGACRPAPRPPRSERVEAGAMAELARRANCAAPGRRDPRQRHARVARRLGRADDGGRALQKRRRPARGVGRD